MSSPQPPGSKSRQRHRQQNAIIAITLYYQRSLLKNPMRTSIRTGKIFTEEILNAHPRRALEVLRMPITTFLDLRDWLSQNSTLRASRYVSMEEQLMSFLWIIGHNASNREAQDIARMYVRSVSGKVSQW
jgi:hypothetical protein